MLNEYKTEFTWVTLLRCDCSRERTMSKTMLYTSIKHYIDQTYIHIENMTIKKINNIVTKVTRCKKRAKRLGCNHCEQWFMGLVVLALIPKNNAFSLVPFSFLFSKFIFATNQMFHAHDYLDERWLGSRLKSFYRTILQKVNGENEWEMYFRNQSC